MGVFVLLAGSTIVILIKAAAGQIAPVTENRSMGLRWCLFGPALLCAAIVAVSSEYYQTANILPLGSIELGVYWLAIGTLMLGESSVLSPRVMRGLPQTYFSRMLVT